MKHRTDTCEKISRALQLHEQGLSSFAIGERLGISSKDAARSIHQAKKRRAALSPAAPPFQPHENCNCLMCLAEKSR